MKVGTRLLLSLLPVVAVIMSAYTGWALWQRQATVVTEARRETRAYATALGLAFDYGLRDVRRENVQQILNRVSQEPTVFGILVYDEAGRRIFASDSEATPAGDATLRPVLSGETVMLERTIGEEAVFSVLRPIRDARGAVNGALEVAQPLARVELEKARVRRRYLLNTLTLLAALTLVTLFLVRRTVGVPMQQLVTAVRAVGRGELGYRLGRPAGGGELADLAREVDHMATGLESARAELIRESEERVALERRVRESEKLAAIGTLATGLAHEIAAPLNVISGRAEMLLRREPSPEVRERHLRNIVLQIGRITTIVHDLLDLSRRREVSARPLEVGAVLDGVAEFLEGELARAGVALVREGTGPAWVHGDPDLLHQVFVNLFLNAVQALDGRAGERRIVVRTAAADGNGAGGGRIAVEIADSGPGIAPELRERVFQPFYTTRSSGTGLGLALARNMVEEQGGRIDIVEPTDGLGATFRIVLPAGDAHA